MIQKMKLVSVVGPVADFDRVICKYISDTDIHIENALSVLDNIYSLAPFGDDSKWAERLAAVEEIFKSANTSCDASAEPRTFTPAEADEIIAAVKERLSENRERLSAVGSELEKNELILKQLEHMRALNVNLDELFKFKFIKFRFGRLPKEGYLKLKSYLENIDAFFVEGELEQDYVYGIYFMPAQSEEKIDAVFSSLYFERIKISDESHGTPEKAYSSFVERKNALNAEAEELTKIAGHIVAEYIVKLSALCAAARREVKAGEVKKLAAHTRESFYIVGWVSEADSVKIEKSLEAEPDVVLVEEEPRIIKKTTPPIKLKNPKIFKPFEMFVEMYGLPSYHEFDPTILLAVSYMLMFGIMFGDVGHGLILILGGWLYYRRSRASMGAIVSLIGVSAVVFGFLYGSIFGNEEIIRELLPGAVLINPMKEINTILISTVCLGALIIIIAMAANIVNAVRSRDMGRALFSQNGLAGMTLYITALVSLALPMLVDGFSVPAPVSAALIIVSLVCIFLKEPLSMLLAGRRDLLPKNKGEFFMEAFFELFEIILSYATNTISFIRLGAFALGHGSMMSVVFILAGMSSGAGSVIILIIGNALVVALEGLVVGIQALRLEFYEMFSRYYTGDGKPFVSIKDR